MRRIVMVGALVALLVGVFAPAALARIFTCTDLPCYGTQERDNINERPAFGVRDEIYGLRGDDRINAGISPGDVDFVHGGRGGDRLITDDGFPEFIDDLDEVRGGRGTDTCRVDEGDAYFNCEVVYIDGVLQP
jgi:hypothetical protein